MSQGLCVIRGRCVIGLELGLELGLGLGDPPIKSIN